MRLCALDIKESLQLRFVNLVRQKAGKYLESSNNSIEFISINQDGQSNNAVAKAVREINESFDGKVARILFDDSGQKYIEIDPNEGLVQRELEKYQNNEDARDTGRVDAERAGMNYSDTYLYKLKGNDNQATVNQVKAAKLWWDLSPLSKNMKLEEMFNVINSNALAQWTNYGITLFHGSNYTDIYHEAFHGFTQLYLTKEQKKALYNEARKVLGGKMSDFQVEEILAEDFRKYILSDSKNVLDQRPERNTIFRKLLRILKQLFGGVSAREAITKQTALNSIQEVYNNLYKGYNLNLKPSIDNAQFAVLNKALTGIQDKTQSLTYEQSSAVVESIDYFISEALDKNNLPISVLFSSEKTLESVYSVALSGLKSVREAINAGLESSIDTLERFQLIEKIQALDFAIENYGDILSGSKRGATGTIAYHKKRSKYLDFKIAIQDLTEILDIDENSITDYTQKFDRTGTEGSLVDYADPVILYTMRSTKTGTTNYFGLPRLYDGNLVFKRVARAVSGTKLTEEQMYDKLVNSKDSILNQIAQKLGDPRVIDSDYRLSMWAKFFQTFNKYQIPIMEMVHVIDANGVYDTYGQAVGDNIKIEKDWYRLFALGKYESGETNPYTTRTQFGTTLNVTKLAADFKSVTHSTIFDYLQAIGIQFDDTPDIREGLQAFTNRVNTYLRPALEKIYTKDSKSADFQGITDVVKLLKTERKDIGLEGNAGLIKDLSEFKRRTSQKIHMGQVQGATGNPINEYSLNNTLTEIVGVFNDPTKTYQDIIKMPHMASWDITKNPLLKNNMILGSVFNLDVNKASVSYRDPKTGKTTQVKFGERFPGAKIELNNFNGVKVSSEKGIVGLATTDLDPFSKFIFDFNAFLSSGDIELMRHASKSSAYAAKASRINSKYNSNNSHLYVDINRFADTRGYQASVELIKQHLANEVTRALTVRNENIEIPGYTEAAKNLTLFEGLLDVDTTNKLLALDYNKDILTQINLDVDLSSKITNSLVKWIITNAEENARIFNKIGYKSVNLRNIGNTNINVAINAYTANSLIHNLEVLSFFYGDAALYNHAKDDFHKRNAGIASTGDKHTMNKASLDRITNKGFIYSKALAAKEGFTVTPFDGILNVAVLNDVIQNLETTNEKLWLEYVNAFEKEGIDTSSLNGYKETNATDGQGYITFDFYKASRELLGKWTPQQEVLYKKIANGEVVDPSTVSKTFPPLKYQYFGPIKTDKLSVYSFHKFSLFPLVPSVIKDTNLELLHNQMARQNVHYVTFKSGSKLADGAKPTDFIDSTGKYTEGNLNTYQVFLPFLKDQVNVSDEFKGEVKFSTQLRKLILQYMYESGFPVSDRTKTLVDNYESLVEKQITLKLEKLYTDLGIAKIDGTYQTKDSAKLLTFLKERLEKRGLPDHVVDYVEQAVNGNIKSALDFSFSANEIEKTLYSIVANDVIRTKVTGELLVQVSSVGFEKQGFELDSKLKFYRKVGGITQPMEVKIALQGSYKELLKLNHNDGKVIGTLERLNDMMKKSSFRVLYKEMLEMVAVRIPVQGHNSMEFMQVAEFLPEEAGISIILPYEITTKSGGDFDIDKLTVMIPNIRVKDGVINMDFSEETIEGVENSIIQSVIEILESPENFVHLIRPNGIDLVQPIAQEFKDKGINKSFNWSNSPIKIIETGYNLYKHESNGVGKKTLGIGAVDNTNNTLMNRTGFELSETMITGSNKFPIEIPAVILLPYNKSEAGGIRLDKLYTAANENIGDIISQLINGWVDVEKDAWIFEIQGNNTVGPVLLFMIQAGVPLRQAINFVSNPLVKEYVERLKINNSPFNVIPGSTKSSRKAAAVKFVSKDKYSYLSQAVKQLYTEGKIPSNFSEQDTQNLADGSASEKVQNKAFIHFLQLEELSQAITNIKLSSNFDTSTFSNSFALNLRDAKVQKAIAGEVVSSKTAINFYNNKILKSFATASFSQKSAWDFFAIRTNPEVAKFISENFSYGDNEAEINNAISQIFTNIYQDALLGADVTAKEYKGIPIQKASLEAGIGLKNGILFVDAVQLRKDLVNINGSLAKFGKARVNSQAFNFRTLSGRNSFDQYFNFSIEREYLRSTVEKKDTETQEQYEEKIRDAALRNSNNLWYMFSSSEEARSYASIFIDIVDRHPQLISQYSVLDDLVLDRRNGVDRLKLSTKVNETDVFNTYYENLQALANPSVQKVEDSVENRKISEFFGQFGTIAFLQNGFAAGEFNLGKIAPDLNYSELMQQFVADKGSNLDEYLSKKVLNKLIKFDEEGNSKYAFRTSVNNYLSDYDNLKDEFVDKTNVLLSTINYSDKNPLIGKDKKFAYLIPISSSLKPAAKSQANIVVFSLPSQISLDEFRLDVRLAFQKLQYLNSEGLQPIMDSSLYADIFNGRPEYYTAFTEEFMNIFGVDPLNLAPSATYREAVQLNQELTDQEILDLIKQCK